MGESTADSTGDPGKSRRPAGRNLPAAVGVGLVLAAVFLAALFFSKPLFVGIAVILVAAAVLELTRALRPAGVRLPLVPLLGGVVAMLVGAYLGGTNVLCITAGITVLLIGFWRLVGRREGYVSDVTAGVFVAMYVPFLAGFVMLLLRPEDGPFRVLIFVALAVLSDVGGYAVGGLLGRHRLAPHISPGKTWEGALGSLASCLLVGWAGVVLLLRDSWWAGLVLGVFAAITAVGGDLLMSMVKRDVGIKDMGTLLPGHGGIMDRLDSLLPTALASWAVLSLLT